MSTTFPRLGVYIVSVDGSGLRQLVDPGRRALTHVRQQVGSSWMTATRYGHDADANGLAMELEHGSAYYQQTEVVVFPRSDPTDVTVIAGDTPGRLCANSTWTDDGRLLFVQQDHPEDPNLTQVKRASFSTTPRVESVVTIPTPARLLLPVDPHQAGPSDDTGTIVFPALFRQAQGWMRPVWRIRASGQSALEADSLVGCPVCPEQRGCCAWSRASDVLGANDPRLNHAGTEVVWMQQHPDVSAGRQPDTIHPWRQQKRTLAMELQQDLPAPELAPTTSLSFPEWRPDDQELVYWTVELVGGVIRHGLYRMDPEGGSRRQIPLPPELCPTHPSYLSDREVVFSAWRCAGADCSCDPKQL